MMGRCRTAVSKGQVQWTLPIITIISRLPGADGAALERDPVCGMSVDPATAKWSAEHEGKAYYFCSEGCRDKFVADPAVYLGEDRFGLPMAHAHHDHAASCRARHAAAAGAGGTTWTCPMHPEIIRDAPGDCPICGMALEPVGVSADAGT